MNIHYDQRYFSLLEVYKQGGYSAAGAVLALTPSAVAQQIHSIERELNVPLFVKGDKKLLPTQECEIVIKYVKNIQLLCERMENDLNFCKYQIHSMTVGVTSSAESFAISRALTHYANRRSEVHVSVRVGSIPELCDALKNGGIDLAIVEGDCSEEELNTIILDTDFLIVAVPHDSKYVQKGMITVEELQREPLILKPKHSGTRVLFEANLKKSGLSPDKFRIMMEADSTTTIKKLVSDGYGISILSNKACIRDVASGKLCTIPLCGINMPRNIRILYRKDFHHDDILKEIQNCYVEAMRELESNSSSAPATNEEEATHK